MLSTLANVFTPSAPTRNRPRVSMVRGDPGNPTPPLSTPNEQDLRKTAVGWTPSEHEVPVAAHRNSAQVTGYMHTTRQRHPPPAAFIDNFSKTFNLPIAFEQRRRAPPRELNIVRENIRGITPNFDERDAYFRNMALRDMNASKVTPERTPQGPPLRGKWFHPRGLFVSTLDSPSNPVPRSTPHYPLYRGY